MVDWERKMSINDPGVKNGCGNVLYLRNEFETWKLRRLWPKAGKLHLLEGEGEGK